WLVDESETQENTLAEREELGGRKALLPNALKTLNDRERHILSERRLKDNPTTLEELSEQYSISRERVRQIEVRAFEKLQKAMKAQVIENSLKRDRASDHASTASELFPAPQKPAETRRERADAYRLGCVVGHRRPAGRIRRTAQAV